MGYDVPSPYNKINIHIGGVYGGKQQTLARFARNVQRLSPSCRARLTVENDDTPNAFSLEDLLPMAHETGIPLVFDFHHFKFIDSTLINSGYSAPTTQQRVVVVVIVVVQCWLTTTASLSEEESLLHAMATWPAGVRPVVHWSESQEGRMPKAHSDYVYGPMNLYNQEVDVMIEAKCKEQALQCFLQHNQ